MIASCSSTADDAFSFRVETLRYSVQDQLQTPIELCRERIARLKGALPGVLDEMRKLCRIDIGQQSLAQVRQVGLALERKTDLLEAEPVHVRVQCGDGVPGQGQGAPGVAQTAEHRIVAVQSFGAGRRPVAELRGMLAAGGRAVIVGGEGGGPVLNGMGRMVWAALTNLGSRTRVSSMLATENADALETLVDLVVRGEIAPAIDRVLPLTDAAAALALLERGEVRGTLVLSA